MVNQHVAIAYVICILYDKIIWPKQNIITAKESLKIFAARTRITSKF